MIENDDRISPSRYLDLAEKSVQQVSEGRADVLSTRLFFNLLRVANRLSKDFEGAIRQQTKLSFAGYQLLFTLQAVGELSSKQLARLASVSTASMSSLLNTMEGRGLITRQTDRSDRRRTLVRLTDQGHATFVSLYLGNTAREKSWSKGLSRDEAETLSYLIDKLLTHRPHLVGEEPEDFSYWQ